MCCPVIEFKIEMFHVTCARFFNLTDVQNSTLNVLVCDALMLAHLTIPGSYFGSVVLYVVYRVA